MSKKRRSLNYHHDINIEDMICDDDDDDGDYVCRSSLRNNNQHVGGNESNCSDVSISEIESEDDDNEDDEDDDEIASESESDDGSYSDSTTDEEDSSCEESFEAKYNTEQFEENSEKPTDDQETLNDEQKECPICLVEFNGQIIGNPENCRHFFCVVCIKEWAKTVNSCPIDRMKFNVINVQRSVNGALLEEYYVDDIDPDKKEEFEMDPTFCQVCNLCDREDRLLLCDECDNGYHLECLTPPLDHVPIEDWYCSRCDSNRTQNTSLVREVQSPVAAAMATAPARGRIRGARTAGGAARVARARRALLAARNINPVLVDDYLPRSTSARGRKRRRTTKGRKTKSNSRRRKTASSGGAKKRRRRSTKTRRVTKKRRLSKKKTKVEEEEPTMVNDEFVKRLASERHSLGSASLERTLSFSLFGNIYDLDAFEGPVPEKEEQKKKDTARPEVDANPDILGKIFDGFDTIDDSDNVTVRRDGSLVRKPGKRAKQITSENEEDAQSSSSMRSARNMKSVLKSESSSTAFSSTIDSKETSSAPRNLVDYSPVKTRLRRSMENSRVSSLAPIVSPSLVDLGCWRESAQNECRDYKPLPAVEKFKNIKIPKLKRRIDGKSSDSDTTRKKNEGRMGNNGENRGIKEEQSINVRVNEDRQDFTKPNCRLKRSSATKNEFSSANFSKRIVKTERHNPLRRGSPLCLLGDVPVNHGPKKSGIDVEHVKKRGGSWNEARTSLNNADDNTIAERYRNLRSANGATSRSAASLPVQNDEVSGANLIKDYRIPRVKASTSLPGVKIEKQACKPSTPVDIIGRILVGDSEDMTEDTYGHIVSETVDSHTGQKEDSELKTVTDANINSNLLFKSKDKRKSLVEKMDHRPSSIDHQRDIRKTVKSEYQADVFRQGNDLSVSSKPYSTKPICASVAGKPEIIETSPQHHKQRGSADDVTKSSTRKISLFGRPMLPCGEKLVAKVSPLPPRDVASLSSGEGKGNEEYDNQERTKEEKKIVARLQRTFIAEQECKKALKPYFKDGRINKDEYKNILKKAVDKIKASSKEIIVDKVEGLIGKYVDHFRGRTAGLKCGASGDKNTSHIC